MERTIGEIAAIKITRGKGGRLSPGLEKRQIRNTAIRMLAEGHPAETLIDWPDPQAKMSAQDREMVRRESDYWRKRDAEFRDLKDSCGEL